MGILHGVVYRLRRLGRHASLEAEMEEELRFHLEMETEKNLRDGLGRAEARRRAVLAFGGVERHKEEMREGRGFAWLEGAIQDLRYGARSLRRSPAFAAAAILTLMLGIGATTAVYSVVDAVVFRPLPYRDGDRLVVGAVSLPQYRDLRERTRSFDGSAVWATNRYKLETEGTAEEVLGAVVSPGFFSLLGDPALGRAFTRDEERAPVAVIGDALWRRAFGARRDVVGRTVELSGAAYTVVGVMPASFDLPVGAEVWVPMGFAMLTAPEQLEDRSLRIFRMVAHLRPGTELVAARGEVRAVMARLAQEHPDTDFAVELNPLYDHVVSEARTPLLVTLAAVGLVLLIACANVANLLLARTAGRGREFAARSALGAGRARVLRQLLTESLLLAGIGGALGVGLAAVALRLLPRVATDIPRLAEARLDGRILLFALGLMLGTAVLFGLAPALRGARASLSDQLRAGGRGAAGDGRAGRLRVVLVAGEVALALTLLVGAGLLVQSLTRMLHQDQGFEADRLLTGNVALFHYDDPARRVVMLEQVLQRVARIPGVEAVGGGTGLPPRTPQRGTGLEVAGRVPDEVERAGAYLLAVTPDYFRALGARVVRGRAFQPSDRAGGAPVVIVNRSLAERLFPGQDPLGRQLRLVGNDQTPVWRTIVGVVPDIRYRGLDDPGEAAIYTPFAQTPFLWSYLMVRTSGSPAGLARAVRDAIDSVDPQLAPARMQPMEEIVGEVLAQRRFQTGLFSAFGALALLLAAVGLYGVVSYSVAQRTREVGVRLALGATPGRVLGREIARSAAVVAVGLAVGVAAAVSFARLLRGLLYQVSPTDPGVYLAIAALLTVVALLASFVPARRAARVDPMVALRMD